MDSAANELVHVDRLRALCRERLLGLGFNADEANAIVGFAVQASLEGYNEHGVGVFGMNSVN